MCGLFGFASRNGKAPDLAVLKDIALGAEKRGGHAFGFAWIDRTGRLHCYKQTGVISDHLGILLQARDARMLVGHCRWATHGDLSNLNNHPHPCDGGWLVHNGVISDHHAIALQYNLWTISHCDSEVIGLLIAKLNGTILERCAKAASIASHDHGKGNMFSGHGLAYMALWTRPEHLVIVRNGNPLHAARRQDGFYWCSVPYALPANHYEVTDGTATLVTASGTYVKAIDLAKTNRPRWEKRRGGLRTSGSKR